MRVTVVYDIKFRRTYRKRGIEWVTFVEKRRSFECDAKTLREAKKKFRSGHRQYRDAIVTVVDIWQQLPIGDLHHDHK